MHLDTYLSTIFTANFPDDRIMTSYWPKASLASLRDTISFCRASSLSWAATVRTTKRCKRPLSSWCYQNNTPYVSASGSLLTSCIYPTLETNSSLRTLVA